MVVGARYDDSAYVFTKPGTGWATATETAKLTASDGVVGDWFGQSVAVDGDTVVVGASEDDGSGSAYVFTKAADSVWTDATQTAKLTASDGDDFDEFGKSVAVDGDTVVAGAPNNDGYGSAYVFIKPAAGWGDATQTAKLTPGATDDGAAGLAGTFGAAVAVDGDTVVVGASAYSGSQGRAYVFTKPSGGWEDAERTAELATSDAEKNQFGWSVAVDGNTVVVGAHTDYASDSVNDSGSVYVFTKATDSVWADATETVKLTATDGASGDQFGWSIAAGGGTVVVGAHWDDDKGADSGSAYVYGVSGWTAIPDSEAGATNATSYTVNDLTNEEEYGFWIRARNTVGTSEASDPVTATPVNTAPTAVDDPVTMYEDKVVTIVVTANDSDIDPVDTLSVTALTTPSKGTAVLASGSATTVTYTPTDNLNGPDSFDYTLSDGTATATGTVSITITAVNDPPTAMDITPTTNEDTAVDITVVNNNTDPDSGDTVTISSFTSPSNGTTASPSSTTFTYTPDTNYNGSDSFVYTLSDGTATATGTVTITVTAVNDAPTAVNDTATTGTDTAVDIKVVANDTDVEGDTLSVTAVTPPGNGMAGKASDTTVTYTPNAGFSGTDSFDYTLSDGTDTATGTVTITVTAGTDPPAKPTGLTASAGLSQVTLNWTDPFNSSITKYEYSKSDSVSESNLDWTDIPNSAAGKTNASSFPVTTDLTNGTKYYFRIRATNSAGTSAASDAVDAVPGNAAPTFADGTATSRSAEENSAEDAKVGEPVAATDPEGDPLTYSLSSSGTDDADSFSIDANGQITVASGANLDYEAKSSYSIAVSVHDGKDADGADGTTTIDDTIVVTIELSDVAEVPAKPGGFTANAGNAQVTLRWGNPSDSSITGRQYLSEQQVTKLTAGDGAASDYFGYSVAVNGDTAVVGAYGDDSSKGVAYVLLRQSGAWSQVAKLTASAGEGGNQLGRSVAVDGDTVVVGAVLADGRVSCSGSAYVFTKPNTGWADATETAKLTASDGANLDLFGYSVAVDGDTVVVGAYWDDDKGDYSGAVYVFTKATDSVWADATETVKLTASDGAADDYFGYSVALDEDTMAVGAYQVNHVNGDGNTVSNSGAAYVFTRQAGVWSQVAKLTVSDRAADDYFGRSVAVDGDMVVVGADQVNHVDGNGNTVSYSGAAYVFTKPSGVWDNATETAKLTASDAAAEDKFGISVAVDGDTVVVGAYQDDDKGENPGSAYVFTKPGTGWATATETAKLTASDGAADDEFGTSVGIDGDTVVVGAHFDDDKGADSGSAYVYGVSGWTAIPDSEAGATNATSYTVNDLTNEEEYGFWIRARNTVGASEASDPVTATPVNTAPTAVDDATTTDEDRAIVIRVLDNDTDVDGDSLSVIAVGTPSNGAAAITGNATTVTYTPNSSFHGSDSFTYTVSDGNGGTDTGTVTVTVTAVDDEPANRSPRFNEGLNTTRTVPENAEVGMAVGDPVNARDSDNDRLEYWLWGMDRASFDVDPSTGQLTTKTALDYEVKNEYSVRVSARDRRGGVDGIIVTISVENVDEPPARPAAPDLKATSHSTLAVNWTAPDNQGPEITDYDLQYREADGEFKDVGYGGTGISMTLSDLKPETGYEVQVRAINAEGVSPWSESGRGETEEAPPPPTPTPAPTAEPVPSEADGGDEGFPWWAIVVVVIGVVAGVVLIIVVRRSRR